MTFTGTTARPARRTLPRNIRAELPNYSMDMICVSYEIALERAREARVASARSAAYTRWVNLSADISRHAFDRGFAIQRSPFDDGTPGRRFIFNRIPAAD